MTGEAVDRDLPQHRPQLLVDVVRVGQRPFDGALDLLELLEPPAHASAPGIVRRTSATARSASWRIGSLTGSVAKRASS